MRDAHRRYGAIRSALVQCSLTPSGHVATLAALIGDLVGGRQPHLGTIASHTKAAPPHEATLVEPTREAGFVDEHPERLIGDKAYASDPLDSTLTGQGIELIAPHRTNWKKPKTHDGRPL